MIFLWSGRNEQHLEKHDVIPEEAQDVIRDARPPYPELLGEGKRSVWGRTRNHRFLQVIFVYVIVEDIEADEYERLGFIDRMQLEDGEEAIRVIHARDLTKSEKQRLNRRK